MKARQYLQALVALLTVQLAVAQIPQTMSYQGRLTDAGGNAVPDGVYSLTFQIYNVSSGGVNLWAETQSSVQVSGGIFSVTLGSQTPLNLPFDTQYWLGISVAGGGELNPRTTLTSSPYSIRALGVQGTSNVFPPSGNVGVGTISPGVRLDVEGRLRVTQSQSEFGLEVANTNASSSSVAAQLWTAGQGPTLNVDWAGSATTDIATFRNYGNLVSSIKTDGGAFFGGNVNTSGSLMTGGVSRISSSGAVGSGGGGATWDGSTIGVNRGGTGTASTLNGVVLGGNPFSAIAGTASQVLRRNLSNTAYEFVAPSGGGDPVGTGRAVNTGTGLTGGGNLSLDRTIALNLGSSNTWTASQTFNGGATFPGSGVWNTAGNVGVGTTAPTAKVHAANTGGTAVRGDYFGGISDIPAVIGKNTSSLNYGIGGTFEGGYRGVYGYTTNSSGGYGIGGLFTGGLYGVFASISTGGTYAGYFSGAVHVAGTLTKSGGSFKIDHPVDPANKYLIHSFVESPDMMNVYNGNITLGSGGEAIVELPAYFEALNKDFRYQLTALGRPGPNLYIAEKISGNRFKIAGGEAGMEVSWQVTGVRKDAWAEQNRIQVEVNKPTEERGSYLHPEVFGLSRDRAIPSLRLDPQLKKAE